jgi:hypothetical protein
MSSQDLAEAAWVFRDVKEETCSPRGGPQWGTVPNRPLHSATKKQTEKQPALAGAAWPVPGSEPAGRLESQLTETMSPCAMPG